MVSDINPFGNQGRTDSRTVKGAESAYRPQTKPAAANNDAQVNETSINISGLAKRMTEFENIASASQEIDSAKVAELSTQIQNNRYHIDAENIAQKLIQADN